MKNSEDNEMGVKNEVVLQQLCEEHFSQVKNEALSHLTSIKWLLIYWEFQLQSIILRYSSTMYMYMCTFKYMCVRCVLHANLVKSH